MPYATIISVVTLYRAVYTAWTFAPLVLPGSRATEGRALTRRQRGEAAAPTRTVMLDSCVLLVSAHLLRVLATPIALVFRGATPGCAQILSHARLGGT